MTTWSRTGIVTVLMAGGLLACTTSRAGGVSTATGGSGSTTQTPSDPSHPERLAPNGREAFRFTARAHEAHYAPVVATLPPPDSLPRFVDGQNKCFVSYNAPNYYGSRPSTGYGVSGQGSGGGGYGYGRLGGSHSTASSSAPKKAAPPASRAMNPSGPADAFADAAAEGAAKGAPMQAAPPAPPRAAPSPSTPAPRMEAKAKDDAKSERARGERDEEYRRPAEPAPSVGWGQAVYLSNDDTMSLSSAQRVLWAVDRFAPIPRQHVRPHELLNYFSFDTADVPADHDFSVVPSAEMNVQENGALTLALAVQGRPLTRDSRRNVNMAYVVDRSGSMAAEGRMDYLKQGLLRSLAELKNGDVVHLTLFDDTACDLAQNFVVGRDSMPRLVQLINMIRPEGSTNLHDGLTRGYAAVDRTYQPGYSNRVVLVTDAIANTGITDEALIATVAKHYDDRKVRLSGVGVGSDFNDSLLDQLTERGKGAYVFLGSSAEVDAVFGSHFVSLVETIATDVHFRLHLPPSLAMKTFYGEEASTVKERVQAIHYFANTSQLFLSDLMTRDGTYPDYDDIMLTVEYTDAESNRQKVEEFAFNLGRIRGRSANLSKAVMVSHFARELQSMAERPIPSGYGERAGGWADSDAASRCSIVQNELGQLGAALPADPEARRVESLWSKFCSRFTPPPPPVVRPVPVPPQEPTRWQPEPPRQPNNEFAPKERWPSATR